MHCWQSVRGRGWLKTSGLGACFQSWIPSSDALGRVECLRCPCGLTSSGYLLAQNSLLRPPFPSLAQPAGLLALSQAGYLFIGPVSCPLALEFMIFPPKRNLDRKLCPMGKKPSPGSKEPRYQLSLWLVPGCALVLLLRASRQAVPRTLTCGRRLLRAA